MTLSPYDYNQTAILYTPILMEKDYLLKIAQRRKTHQMGRFLIQPYSRSVIPLNNQPKHQHYLHEIIVPANLKQPIFVELQRRNITKDRLFVKDEDTAKVISVIDEIVKKIKSKYNL